jgi:hypothetical protein
MAAHATLRRSQLIPGGRPLHAYTSLLLRLLPPLLTRRPGGPTGAGARVQCRGEAPNTTVLWAGTFASVAALPPPSVPACWHCNPGTGLCTRTFIRAQSRSARFLRLDLQQSPKAKSYGCSLQKLPLQSPSSHRVHRPRVQPASSAYDCTIGHTRRDLVGLARTVSCLGYYSRTARRPRLGGSAIHASQRRAGDFESNDNSLCKADPLLFWVRGRKPLHQAMAAMVDALLAWQHPSLRLQLLAVCQRQRRIAPHSAAAAAGCASAIR